MDGVTGVSLQTTKACGRIASSLHRLQFLPTTWDEVVTVPVDDALDRSRHGFLALNLRQD